VYSRLKGKAKELVITFVEVGVSNRAGTTKKLLYRLDLLYGQKDRKQRAIRNLSKISQEEIEPFILFYSRFEKKIANTQAENWPNDSKISYFQNALNDKIKAVLVFISTSEIKLLRIFMSRILRDYTFYTKPSFRFAEEIVHKCKKLHSLVS
jgi:hypothetical protein